MRFVVGQDFGKDSYHSHTQVVLEEFFDNDSLHCTTGALSAPVRKANASNNPSATCGSFSVTTKFPASVSGGAGGGLVCIHCLITRGWKAG